jgi:hypothetical protein
VLCFFPFLLSHDLLSSGSRACHPLSGSHIDFSFHSGSTFHKYIPNACGAMDKQKKREQHPSVSYRLVFASRKPMSCSLNGISPYKNKKPVISQPCGTVILLAFIQTKQSVQCRYLLLPKRQRTNNIYKKMIAYLDLFVKGAAPRNYGSPPDVRHRFSVVLSPMTLDVHQAEDNPWYLQHRNERLSVFSWVFSVIPWNVLSLPVDISGLD